MFGIVLRLFNTPCMLKLENSNVVLRIFFVNLHIQTIIKHETVETIPGSTAACFVCFTLPIDGH